MLEVSLHRMQLCDVRQDERLGPLVAGRDLKRLSAAEYGVGNRCRPEECRDSRGCCGMGLQLGVPGQSRVVEVALRRSLEGGELARSAGGNDLEAIDL